MKDLYSMKMSGDLSKSPLEGGIFGDNNTNSKGDSVEVEIINPEDVMLEEDIHRVCMSDNLSSNNSQEMYNKSYEIDETIEYPIVINDRLESDDIVSNEHDAISKLESAVDRIHDAIENDDDLCNQKKDDEVVIDKQVVETKDYRVKMAIGVALTFIVGTILTVFIVLRPTIFGNKDNNDLTTALATQSPILNTNEDIDKKKGEWLVNEIAENDTTIIPSDATGINITDGPIAANAVTTNKPKTTLSSSKKSVSGITSNTVDNNSVNNTTSANGNTTASSSSTMTNTNSNTSNSTFVAKTAMIPSSVQKGVILHAFNWSYNTIKSNLADIANAGYTAVQTSPVQRPKDYSASWTDVSGQWWKLYQPVSLSVADSSWIGTKSELTQLCSEADKYGIKIICDIVVNHMGSTSDSNVNLNEQIATYEPEIYNNYSECFHSYIQFNSSDTSIQNIVRGNIGMPDLNTESSIVQNRVSSLLSECIDCGVDGFRFDAAKHIETSSDGIYSSSFWNSVLQRVKQKNLYIYGEILGSPGTSRSINSYTSFMSITDDVKGNTILSAVSGGNAITASASKYYKGSTANKYVLWAESHDTFISSTKNISQSIIDKAYAINASRADATTLYLARPSSTSGNMGTMGQAGSSAWKQTSICAVNTFHNYFVGSSEYLSYNGVVVMNERYNSDGTCGIILVNISSNTYNISNISINKMSDGTYYDQITGNKFIVSGGKISGNIGSSGIAVVY